jgi:cytochrome o ubiquinol oxidase subunit IV
MSDASATADTPPRRRPQTQGGGPTPGHQHGDKAPGEHHDDADVAGGVRAYLIGLGLAALLTVGSFALSYTHLVYGPGVPVALIVFAVAQIGIHLVFFLHLTTAPDNINNSLALAFGTLILIVLIAGTMWIMGHMNSNMMPMSGMMHMGQ